MTTSSTNILVLYVAHQMANMQATPYPFPRLSSGQQGPTSEIKAALAQPSKLAQQELLQQQQQQRTNIVTTAPPAQLIRAVHPSSLPLPTAARMPFDARTSMLMPIHDGKPIHELQSGFPRFEMTQGSEPRHASSAPHLYLTHDMQFPIPMPFPMLNPRYNTMPLPFPVIVEEIATAGGRPPSNQRMSRGDQSSPKASSVATASYPSPAIPSSSDTMHLPLHKPLSSKEIATGNKDISTDATPLTKLLEVCIFQFQFCFLNI